MVNPSALSAGATPASNHSHAAGGKPSNPAEFIYAANQAAENVSGYRIELKNGKISKLPGSPYRSGHYPVSISMSPDSRFVYAANQGSATVSAYTVNPDDGSLQPVAGSPHFALVLAGVAENSPPVSQLRAEFVIAQQFDLAGSDC